MVSVQPPSGLAPAQGSANNTLFVDKLVSCLVAISKQSGYLKSLECLKVDDPDDLVLLRAQTYLSSVAYCPKNPQNKDTPGTKEKGKEKEKEKSLTFDLYGTTFQVIPQHLLTHDRSDEPKKRLIRGAKAAQSLVGLRTVVNLCPNPFESNRPYALWTFTPPEESEVKWRLSMFNIEDQVRNHLAVNLPPLDKHLPRVPFTPEFWTEHVPTAVNFGFRIHLFNCEGKQMLRGFITLRNLVSPTAELAAMLASRSTPSSDPNAARGTTMLDSMLEYGKFDEITGGMHRTLQRLIFTVGTMFEATKPMDKLLKDVIANAKAVEQGDAVVFAPGFAKLCRKAMNETATGLRAFQDALLAHDKELRACLNALGDAVEGHKCTSLGPGRPDKKCLDCIFRRIKIWYDEVAPLYRLWACHFKGRPLYAAIVAWSMTEQGGAVLQRTLKAKAKLVAEKEAKLKKKAAEEAKAKLEADSDSDVEMGDDWVHV